MLRRLRVACYPEPQQTQVFPSRSEWWAQACRGFSMPATIVVGGQYGSEGKGKVAALLATQARDPWLVRCGGPNSGHSVTINRIDVILRQVPCSTTPGSGMFCLAAGCVIDENLLIDELELLGIDRQRIIVDPRAVIVMESDREQERRDLAGIASTCSGTG